MSLGETRVRTTFNPSADSLVEQLKQKSADLINLCETMKHPSGGGTVHGEQARLVSLAQTAYEEAAMWAVKATTFGK